MKKFLLLALAAASWVLPRGVAAQQPCADTLVRLRDSVCQGQTYDFNGRTLVYGGYYYDTLPRAVGGCDSVVILQLAVLEYPLATPGAKTLCTAPVGYDVAVYENPGGYYYHWTATPEDSSLHGQEHNHKIYVSPRQPTTYQVTIDYRAAPQCPSSGSITLNPVDPVRAQMYVSPDHLSYDQLEIQVEDLSVGNRGSLYGGWSGRKWYLNGVQQAEVWARGTFDVSPTLEGDSVEVKMVAFTPTCSDMAVRVLPFRRVAVYFPNVFTPGDGPEALFYPRVQGLLECEWWVYDRRGALVFHSYGTAPWDGTRRGRPCPAGTYVYKCRYRDLETPAGFQSLAGTVTLLR